MIAKMAFKIFLLIIGSVVMFKGVDFLAKLHDRETLDAELKPVLASLTPVEVIQRCGPPDIERISDLLFRDLTYQRSGVVLNFIRSGTAETDWIFSSIDSSPPGRKNQRRLLDSLPCLK
jgi:hypothetical protein